jgi:hypothetical protein
MSKVQTAVLHTDTLWVDHYNIEGQPYKEKFTSFEEANLMLSTNGYKFTGQSFYGRQKVYMRAIAEKEEAADWAGVQPSGGLR